MKLTCKRSERTCADGALSWKLMALMTVSFAALTITLEAAAPGWWTSRGAVASNNTPNAVVTVGQLKQFTARAVDEMNAHLSGGAGASLTNLVYGWHQDYSTNGYSGSHPKPSDSQVATMGQLKYIGNLIWNRQVAAGYTDVLPIWFATTNSNPNLAVIGQAKMVLDFDYTISKPLSPSSLTVVLASNQAVLNWSDSSNNVQSYVIQQSTDGGTTWTTVTTVSGTTTSYTASGLTLGTPYTFRVIADATANIASASAGDTAPIITLTAPSGATLVP
jgi:hypothetical protein